MTERKFQLMMGEILGEFEAGGYVRARQYQEKVIDKLNIWEKICFSYHMFFYDRKLRDVQHIKLV